MASLSWFLRILDSLLRYIWCMTAFYQCSTTNATSLLSPVVFNVVVGPSASTSNFRHPTLTDEEMRLGCRLGIDSWADTSCAGKHAHVLEFVEGRTVTAHGFASSLTPIANLSIANVAYAYDTADGETFLFIVNNSIYLGDLMEDGLLNPIQCMENNIRIDIRPRRFCPDDASAQTFSVPSLDMILPITYDGVLPFLSVRRPCQEELDTCTRIHITSDVGDWNPHLMDALLAPVSHSPSLPMVSEVFNDDYLSDRLIGSVLSSKRVLIPDGDDAYSTVSKMATQRSDRLSPEKLSQLWRIGLKTAERTLKASTHQCIRTTGVLTRRFRTDKAHMRFKQLSTHHGEFYADYLKCAVKSIRGFIGGTVYTNKLGFKKFFPMSTEQGEENSSTLRSFIQLIGIPRKLHTDNHNNFAEGAFKRACRRFGVLQSFTEAHSPWQNRAEPAIGDIKGYARRLMMHTQTPIRLWCFCYEFSADLLSLCATARYDLQGRSSYEHVVGYTPDITEYVSFSWYQWIYYWDQDSKEKRLGKWLGPAHKIGQALCYYVLIDNAEFIARSSVIPVPDADLLSDEMKTMTTKFTSSVEDKIGNYRQPTFDVTKPESVYFSAFDDPIDVDDNVDFTEFTPTGELVDAPISRDQNDAYFDDLDDYINTHVVVPGRDGATNVLAKIVRRKRDSSGTLVGTSHSNPILDSRIFELEFPDGRTEEYALNSIVESLYAQVDDEGFDTGIMDEIVGHRVDRTVAIPISDGMVLRNKVLKPVRTTKGWDIQLRWKDGSIDWLPLSVVKESYPVAMAEYAIGQNLALEPAFRWWARHVLRKRDHLISKVQTRVRKGHMKFGVIVPRTLNEAKDLDRENGNTLWTDAVEKEFKDSRIAFDPLADGDKAPPGWSEITCHLIFDVKMTLRRKARYVAGGHLVGDPGVSTFASVVSRDSVRIGFLIAALNGLDILAGDIQNAYLHAPSLEKNYFYAGPEWGANEGRVILIIRALYGQKSAGAAWRAHLADTICSKMKFTSSLADPDVWYKANTKPNGDKYYTYILVYTDDVLIIDTDPSRYMDQLKESYPVKPDSIGPPTEYLGSDISQIEFTNASGKATPCWAMGSASYVKEAVRNVKERLKKDNFRFDPKLSDPKISAKQPFSTLSYLPELDTSAMCDAAQTTYYQNLIGVLRWIVELGRIDINYEVSVLSRYLAAPRSGHLQQALHIFKYLDIHRDNELAFDPTYLDLPNPSDNTKESKIARMKKYYPDAEEAMPPNAPEPRGQPVQINCFVDADHAGDRMTRRSQTGVLIYLNMAPIIWYSKRQTTVETSTFGSEFVALKTATEMIIALRYKLRMFGIPIDGPANVMCDNESVFKSSSIADSRLKKKSQSICYHMCREAVASGIQMIYKEITDTNLADILTKALGPVKRLQLRKMIMISCSGNTAHAA